MTPPVIDAHVHAWPRWPYPPSVQPPADARAERLVALMDRAGVERAVLVGAQITHNEDNNAYLFAARSRFPDRLAVFPDHDSYWSPPDPAPPLDRLAALARHGIAGISVYLGDDENGDRLLDPRRDAAFAHAAGHGIAVGLGMRPWHAPAVRRLTERHPTLTVLGHHLGGIKARFAMEIGDQLDAVVSLADRPNLLLKLSGLDYLGRHAGRVVAELRDAYGPERLCWGSNWPVTAATPDIARAPADEPIRYSTMARLLRLPEGR
ncbi:amidohydrolase family protein [Dactylosporangium sp. CA-092794]|uniref:amidohydrolase family protein n=1 Tax=Dactylosporangium sp. CA-092794 TaxID=3239929 RepID=UPI003D8BFE06